VLVMSDEPWHLDKRVPVALIFTLLMQSALGVWWASNLSNDVTTLKSRQDKQENLIESMRTTASQQAVQLGRIEENTRSTSEAVSRLLKKIEGP
jgi:Tfp pilus assembly protein PilO